MGEYDFDETDFKLLCELDKEHDIDVDAVSDELGISASTVYYRIERYRENGIIKDGHPNVLPEKIGLDITAVSEIKSEYGPGYDEIGDRLSEISGVQRVHFMLGDTSFIIISRVRDHDHLQQLIDDIIHTDGVTHSSTSIALKTFKDDDRLLVNYDDDDLEAIFNLD